MKRLLILLHLKFKTSFPVKANGSVIIMCNAIFLKKRRQELLWRGNVLRPFSSFCRHSLWMQVQSYKKKKKAETCAISTTMRKAKDCGFFKIHIFSDAMNWKLLRQLKELKIGWLEIWWEIFWMSRALLWKLNFLLFLGIWMGLYFLAICK